MLALDLADPVLVRVAASVRGQVQGVGFRPHVSRLAGRFNLSGWVRNDRAGVRLEVQGEIGSVHAFFDALQRELPGPAHITQLLKEPAKPLAQMPPTFQILVSETDGAAGSVVPDLPPCASCLPELFDVRNRRYRYPFISCAQCGPRYSMVRGLPFDRERTSMADFPLCGSCLAEYKSPADRRFHAQATACGCCGPSMVFAGAASILVGNAEPLRAAAQALRQGQILAVKGVGGFHLVCDARNAQAVTRLRVRKRRPDRPLAVMVLNCASVPQIAQLSAQEEALLRDTARPVVLLQKTLGFDALYAGIAPGLNSVGVLLPYTPLHYLLFNELLGCPDSIDWVEQASTVVLVMTSANTSGEPLVIDNDEARARLSELADGFLFHDRQITQRCDDSVLRPIASGSVLLRRGRGYVPQAIPLAMATGSVLACGGAWKNTVCVTHDGQAYLSPHVGDLESVQARRVYVDAVDQLVSASGAVPKCVAHDAHPDYYTSTFAREFATRHGIPAVAVQHHHAHLAAVLAEHQVVEPVLGLALDGTGWGLDGTAWGGELLHLHGALADRCGHFATLPLPGGDRAAREPWRLAAAVLHSLGRSDEIVRRFDEPAAATVVQMLDQKVQCPRTSSAGRWFDAAAGLLGVRHRTSYEGQAAMELEALASAYGAVAAMEAGYEVGEGGVLSLLPLMSALADIRDRSFGAALFHSTLVRALVEWAARYAEQMGVEKIALSGGCFCNRFLLDGVSEGLASAGYIVLANRQVPPNDGGLSLGQAWVAVRCLQEGV